MAQKEDEDIVVILEFSMSRGELEEFVEEHGDVNDWAFGEICQNQGFGFLTGCQIRKV